MSSSAINSQLFQAKIGSIQNQADTSAVYSAGVWSFKNSTALTSVTITDAGNVGIGTTSPGQKLHVNGGIVRIDSTNILFINPNYDNGNSIAVQGFSNVPLVFTTNNTERMRLDASGNVGIGTSSPQQRLHVAGNIQLGAASFPSIKYADNANDVKAEIYYGIGGNDLNLLNIKSGPVVFSTNNTERGRIDANGAWTLGPSSGLTGAHTFQSSATIGNQMTTFLKTAVTINQNNNIYSLYAGSNGTDGYIQTNGSAVLTIVDASDMRWKENIRNASYGLSTIKSLRPVEFDWKSGIKNVKGFIAQEVKEVLPESVSIKDESENGGLSDMHYLETQTMIPVLVKAIQELSAKNDALEARLAALESKP